MDHWRDMHLNPEVGPCTIVQHSLPKLEAQATAAISTGGVVEHLAGLSLYFSHPAVDHDGHEREAAEYHAKLEPHGQ